MFILASNRLRISDQTVNSALRSRSRAFCSALINDRANGPLSAESLAFALGCWIERREGETRLSPPPPGGAGSGGGGWCRSTPMHAATNFFSMATNSSSRWSWRVLRDISSSEVSRRWAVVLPSARCCTEGDERRGETPPSAAVGEGTRGAFKSLLNKCTEEEFRCPWLRDKDPWLVLLRAGDCRGGVGVRGGRGGF